MKQRDDYRNNPEVVELQQILVALRFFIPEIDFANTIGTTHLGVLAVSAILTASKPQLKLMRSLDKSLRA